MSEEKTRDQNKFIVRMPDGMRDRLKAEAEANGRSMNAEIVHRLQNSLDGIAGGFMEEEVKEYLDGKPVDYKDLAYKASYELKSHTQKMDLILYLMQARGEDQHRDAYAHRMEMERRRAAEESK